MSGPKHLWSGDWQRESEAASASRAHRAPQTPSAQPDEPATETIPPRRPRRRLRRPRVTGSAAFVAVAVLVLAGAAFGLSSLLGSSSPRRGRNHPGPLASATAPGATIPTLPMPTVPPSQITPQTQTGPQTQTNPQPSPAATTPTVNWLGMQIATQPPGAAVVQTVAIGSPADRAGINPGEVIQAIDGRPIHSAQAIAAALRGLPRGARVTLQLVYGSGSSQTRLTLGAPPSVAP